MSMPVRSLLRRFAVSALHRPPIVVQQTASAGRGVFATRDIAQGEFIYSAEPIVAHPKLDYVSKVCYYCLRARDQQLRPSSTMRHSEELLGSSVLASRALEADRHDPGGVSADGEAPHFCSALCAASAENFLMIESRGDWSELYYYCRKNSLKFPLVARRLACMVVAGAASPNALDILSYPSFLDGSPLQWREERALLLRTLKRAGVQASVLEWVIARLHVNAFAVEMIDTASYADLFDAAASSISGEGSVGTAVYTLPSMYNHDCDPNVHVQWPGSASVRLEARQTIKAGGLLESALARGVLFFEESFAITRPDGRRLDPVVLWNAGEELRITYVDASLAYHARQEILSSAYGFLCVCPRCRDRD